MGRLNLAILGHSNSVIESFGNPASESKDCLQQRVQKFFLLATLWTHLMINLSPLTNQTYCIKIIDKKLEAQNLSVYILKFTGILKAIVSSDPRLDICCDVDEVDVLMIQALWALINQIDKAKDP